MKTKEAIKLLSQHPDSKIFVNTRYDDAYPAKIEIVEDSNTGDIFFVVKVDETKTNYHKHI